MPLNFLTFHELKQKVWDETIPNQDIYNEGISRYKAGSIKSYELISLVVTMRDRDTFETAMHAAETGHLVFGTIHASSAPSTIGRILDLFPQTMHRALRSSMGFNMKAIVAQKLLPTILDKPKRVPITEIMIFNGTIRKLILEEMDEKLPAAIRIGKQEGMQQFNDSLYHFVTKEFVSRAEAFEISPNVEELKMMLKGINVKSSGIL